MPPMPPPPILTLLHPPAYDPYTPAVPSRYASDTALNSPNLLCQLPSLRSQDEITMPPISALTTPYASAPLLLTILTLPSHPQDMPPTPPSTPLTPNPLSATYHPYTQVLDP
ncbi:hypothetical protein O181_080496 [Austropuccinia psidii MF-1]|uniref:Uncharacterized protein n=1 Tax=Austropuccinia psidii MF-1 TaxID=1389203 RepID=A0A9Q3FIB7_9BASI|nr:hypothetical protein [Austropuccinia psidii MF-1]